MLCLPRLRLPELWPHDCRHVLLHLRLGRCQPVHAVRDRQRPDLRRGCVLQRGSGQALPRQARRAAALLWPELHSEHHPVLPLPGECIFHARARAPVRHRHLQRLLHRSALRHDRRNR